jgi:SAM-dependent methyltransferase
MSGDADALRAEKRALEQRYGAWTAHNVRLHDDVYTLSPHPAGDEVKLRRVVQIASDVFGASLTGVRVLDLACLEGMYSLELARRGAEVIGVEGREANVEKARFAARTLGLDVDFRLGDVRDLSREEHGEFDLVLALGILYHLDGPDLFALADQIATVCRRALIVDTAVGSAGSEEVRHAGHAYRGVRLVEHAPDSTREERLQAVWSSLDNLTAVALTRPSLERLLARQGFTSVYECHVPAEPLKEIDRVTLLALKGVNVGGLIAPAPEDDGAAVPERPPLARRLEASGARSVARRLVPRRLRARLRRALGVETRHH